MATFLNPSEIKMAKQIASKNPRLEGFVPGSGSLTPRFTILSEAPGRIEIKVGKGFMGPAGKQLDQWLKLLGITRDQIYITGVVRSRPISIKNGRKRDRKPTKQEMFDYAPILDYELSQLPKENDLLVTLGNTGLQRLLGDHFKIGDVHGKLLKRQIRVRRGNQYGLSSRTYRIFPTYHPSYARRFPSKRPVAEADMQKLKQIIKR
ncbi:uracil-DNA glycosylase [Philodulcilactobacillus myokoensis]|uniref:Uracil-DNA glycosylase n=1 Tax=Philodulcilactobacillus myokoensis TaxID=2929573 RepID=A0A9W6B058_9LACO|nr:uracil-DNA glycosylase [Philodulcilactobacillus myokoensis]GLB46048.1 uracil-DNA glycosylase [Philodulcilactobacillus myokoensis]